MHLIRKISFDPEMSPLSLNMTTNQLASSSMEIEGMIKIQPIAGVDDTILCSLGWSNLEFLNKRRVGTYHPKRGPEGSQTQVSLTNVLSMCLYEYVCIDNLIYFACVLADVL